MMNTEQKIRNYIRKILLTEEEVTVRPGRGGYKKEIRDAGALAKQNPAELMSRLKISRATDNSDIKRLNSILSQASTGTPAMQVVYGSPSPRKDNVTGYEGVRIPISIIPPRDARKYLEHTVVGAQAAKHAIFDKEIQVEILGKDILVYFADKPYSWGRTGKKSKQPEQQSKPPPAEPQKELSVKDDELIGEPDFNHDRAPKDEVSMSGIPGAMTPMGTTAAYPSKHAKKPSRPETIIGRAFGDAKPYKSNKK